MKVGIIGMGVVGKAVYHAFSPVIPDLKCYDKDGTGNLEELRDRDFIFICVPATAIRDVVDELLDGTTKRNIVFILKSTVVPGTTDDLQHMFGNYWVFNPEFLTDRTANLDFINSPKFILGGAQADRVEELYRERFRHTPIFKTTTKSAEFVKYMTNLYFMTKISFMNEMRNVSDELGLPWDSVVKMFVSDGRVTNSHLEVPGPDGKKGFGGKCFPENINTYLDWAERNGINDDLIHVVREVNYLYRED